MKREDRVEQLLTLDRELMARLKASPEAPDLLRQRKQVKSQMNLYGPAATARLLDQEFEEFTDLVTEREEERRGMAGEASRAFRKDTQTRSWVSRAREVQR